VKCECGAYAKSNDELRAHRMKAHRGPNSRAAGKLLAQLAKTHRTEDIDCARVQTVRTMAAALDADPFNAPLWKVYREAVNDLMRIDDDADDSLEAAVKALERLSPVGNPAKV
jgi:hypothetical protein